MNWPAKMLPKSWRYSGTTTFAPELLACAYGALIASKSASNTTPAPVNLPISSSDLLVTVATRFPISSGSNPCQLQRDLASVAALVIVRGELREGPRESKG